MRQAYLDMPADMLHEFMQLPADVRIVWMESRPEKGCLRLHLEGDGLPSSCAIAFSTCHRKQIVARYEACGEMTGQLFMGFLE